MVVQFLWLCKIVSWSMCDDGVAGYLSVEDFSHEFAILITGQTEIGR